MMAFFLLLSVGGRPSVALPGLGLARSCMIRAYPGASHAGASPPSPFLLYLTLALSVSKMIWADNYFSTLTALVCYGALFSHVHAGVGMHVLGTLLGQPPLHGTYMFLSLIAGLGVRHFMTWLCLLYWEQAFGVWVLLHSQEGISYFRSSLSKFAFLWICWCSIDPHLFVMMFPQWSH